MNPAMAYNGSVPANQREIVQALDREIAKGLPKAESKVWHAMPVWFVDANPVVGYKSSARHVTLLFWNGQAFNEPSLVPAGKFKAAQIQYASADSIRVVDLRRWLRKAARDIWDYKGLRADCS